MQAARSETALDRNRKALIGGVVPCVSDASDFVQINDHDRDALILRRPIPRTVSAWLSGIPFSQLPNARLVLSPDGVPAAIDRLFRAVSVSHDSDLNWLCQDLGTLASSVCSVAKTKSVRLRVEAVSDNACARFHVDHVLCRLICTYLGPGTQITLSSDNDGSCETVPTGAPLLLKGRLWPTGNEVALKHRSPPIAGTGQHRCVIVLEPVTDTDDYSVYDQGRDAVEVA